MYISNLPTKLTSGHPDITWFYFLFEEMGGYFMGGYLMTHSTGISLILITGLVLIVLREREEKQGKRENRSVGQNKETYQQHKMGKEKLFSKTEM